MRRANLAAALAAAAAAAAALLAGGSAGALEPETSPLHFVFVLDTGWTQLLGRPGSWAGDCRTHGVAGACANQIVAVESFTDQPGDLGTGGLGAVGVGVGFGFGLSRLLSLQILADGRYALGGVGAAPSVSQNGSTFQLGPGFTSEEMIDLPVDLRLRLGSYWVVYGGLSPALASIDAVAQANTSSGTRDGSMNGWAGALLWRAGIDRFFDYRATALGLLVEGATGGGVGALLTLTFHGGDSLETIR